MAKLTKGQLVDLALNMVRHINAVVDDDFLDLDPSRLDFTYNTKSYKVRFAVSEKDEDEAEDEE